MAGVLRWQNRVVRILLLLLAAWLAGPLPAQSPAPADLDRLTRQITEITGFAAKRPIPWETITREGWKQWVENEIREQVKPEEIRAEELTLKMFGLLPEDFDLRQATVDLLAEQAAAVYDHRRKRMLFVEGGPGGLMNGMVVVHELAHALAGQQFDLTRFIDKAPKTDEAQAARLAVVEGQAMWVMLEANLRQIGQSLAKDPGMIAMFTSPAASAARGLYPAFDNAPLYLRETLMFPYMAGLQFQQKAVERYGARGFTEVFRRPPSTTREVLHPEVWLAGETPQRPPLPSIGQARGYERLTAGSVGELDFRILFAQYSAASDAEALAAQWRGGAFELLEHQRSREPLLRWSTVWSDAGAAARFLESYKRVLEGKAAGTRFTRETPWALEGANARGGFRITRMGARVEGVEGLKPGG